MKSKRLLMQWENAVIEPPMTFRKEDNYEDLWQTVLQEQAPDLEVPYGFIISAANYGFGFHRMLANIVCDYILDDKVYNILYVFPSEQSLAYMPKHLTALSIEATGSPVAAEALMADLDEWKETPNPDGRSYSQYQYLSSFLLHTGKMWGPLHRFLIAIKGRDHEMAVPDFLASCGVDTIEDLSPEELMDFSSRFLDEYTPVSLMNLFQHPFGEKPDWKKVAGLIAEAYRTGKSLRWTYIVHADILTWPKGYNEDDPSKFGLQYRLVDR